MLVFPKVPSLLSIDDLTVASILIHCCLWDTTVYCSLLFVTLQATNNVDHCCTVLIASFDSGLRRISAGYFTNHLSKSFCSSVSLYPPEFRLYFSLNEATFITWYIHEFIVFLCLLPRPAACCRWFFSPSIFFTLVFVHSWNLPDTWILRAELRLSIFLLDQVQWRAS